MYDLVNCSKVPVKGRLSIFHLILDHVSQANGDQGDRSYSVAGVLRNTVSLVLQNGLR